MADNFFLFAFTSVFAGLLSFFSPCVLPLLPSYLCIIGGTPKNASAEPEAERRRKPGVVARTGCFILGFSSVFITLSVLLSATFLLMGGAIWWINLIAGIIVIVLGLNIIFDFISFVNYEKRFNIEGKQRGGFIGAFLTGGAFGASWTPCVGPVLAGILLLAGQSGNVPSAVFFLVCYSAGLGLPFILASIFFSKFMKVSAKLRPRLPLIRKISGALLTAIGVLIVTGQYERLNAFLISLYG